MIEHKGVLIVGETADGNLAPITIELLSLGRRLADELKQELSAIFIGSEIGKAANEAVFYGADKVYVIDHPLFKNYLNDTYIAALDKLIKQVKPEILLFGHTSLGRDLAPRLAFRLETGLTQDCLELAIDPQTKLLKKTKPVYGGNALAVYTCAESRPQMATVRAKVMKPAVRDSFRKGELIPFALELDEAVVKCKLSGTIKEEVKGIKLEDANVVVCGGRGIGGSEPFQRLEELAKTLGGAVGSTRPPCDAKWVPSYYQIGLTGKLVSPSLYIGVALSGASQHLAGMSGSKIIVAINKDPEASIFRVAHYGVIGEYEKILPALIEKCKELLSKT
jgi:electron transfer flavoprotein alpha subunit